MEERMKYAVYALCGAAGLALVISVWALGKASSARADARSLRKDVIAGIDERLKQLEDAATQRRTVVDGRFKQVDEDMRRLSDTVDTVRAGRQEAKEYANQKFQDALNISEERFGAFGRERDGKLKEISDKMEELRRSLEKHVEDKCATIRKYIDGRLSAY